MALIPARAPEVWALADRHANPLSGGNRCPRLQYTAASVPRGLSNLGQTWADGKAYERLESSPRVLANPYQITHCRNAIPFSFQLLLDLCGVSVSSSRRVLLILYVEGGEALTSLIIKVARDDASADWRACRQHQARYRKEGPAGQHHGGKGMHQATERSFQSSHLVN